MKQSSSIAVIIAILIVIGVFYNIINMREKYSYSFGFPTHGQYNGFGPLRGVYPWYDPLWYRRRGYTDFL